MSTSKPELKVVKPKRANQHSKANEKLVGLVSELTAANTKLDGQLNKLSGLVADIIHSVTDAFNIVVPTALYLDGLVTYKPHDKNAIDAAHVAQNAMRVGMNQLKNMCAKANEIHGEILEINTKGKEAGETVKK